MAARIVALLALGLIALRTGAAAQQLQRLHVRSFVLNSDTDRPRLEQPFHVTLTIGVPENVRVFENVYLPMFTGAEELGDEHEVTHARSGTVYRETLTLVAHQSGVLTVSSAYLDAVDARDGKPKRFFTNGLHLIVSGAAPDLWTPLRTILLVLLDILLALAAIFVVFAIFRKSRASRPDPPSPVEMPPAQRTPAARDAVADALSDLYVRRDRTALMRLRVALWNRIGARDGETLGDVLRHDAAAQPDIRELLLLVERAAFIEDERFPQALEHVVRVAEHKSV